MKNLPKTYDPSSFEGRIYQSWEDDGDFVADAHSDKKPYTIVMPPPNVTGKLHLGHAMNNTLQDILIRWKRMSGYEVLWIPGTDHASISTEVRVEKELAREGLRKQDVGREKFLEMTWDWTREYGGTIRRQLRRLGVSCDWSRERFTLDEGLSEAVYKVFKDLYDDGLIYQGYRIVNWCPHDRTALSDAEVEHVDEKSSLWYIRYPLADSENNDLEQGKITDYIMVATTRPETMFGDLAVAVNPEDDRYKNLVGKEVILPLVGRRLPIIADSYVDMKYGTGAVKITPSHDPNDFEVGARHQLGQCVVIEGDGRIAEGYGPYSGLNRFDARKAVVEDLEKQGLLDHTEELVHSVGHCERCRTAIEPLLSKQWFVRMEELIQPARQAVANGDIRLIPQYFEKTYFNWTDHIHDWTISRQLWWGHRIPVWYCQDCGEVVVSNDDPGTCPRCGSKHLEHDPDTLDTWFSSALWAFSTMGWPEESDDFKKFFPTDTLVTGYDILFFWIIRMAFMTLYETGEVPFNTVYLTGLIRDSQGRKMSKSLGNGVDPIDVIEEYGADALRFALITGTAPGHDTRFSYDYVEACRNFGNKLWNASRFFLMNYEEGKHYTIDWTRLEPEDKWILSTLNSLSRTMDKNLSNFEIGLAGEAIYDFSWGTFCDWYIEFVKPRLYGDDEGRKDQAMAVLQYCLSALIRLLHPFMPFITEEIWDKLPFTEGKCIKAAYPKPDSRLEFPEEEKAIAIACEAITAIRNERAKRDIAVNKRSKVILQADSPKLRELLSSISYQFVNLASASEVELVDQDPQLAGDLATVVQPHLKIYLPLEGLVDYAKEVEKLEKSLEKAKNELLRAEKKLGNQGFLSHAPQEVVQKEREKEETYQKMIRELEKTLQESRKKLK